VWYHTIVNITGWGIDQTNMWLRKVSACTVERLRIRG